MARASRQWFKTGSVMVYIDFELRGPVAYVESTSIREDYKHWTPNQDADLFVLCAHAGTHKKKFKYNPHDQRDTQQALLTSLLWCIDKVGPPIHFVSSFAFILKCLMFWKYTVLWDGLRISGIQPRGKEWKTAEEKFLESEWEQIRKQLENE